MKTVWIFAISSLVLAASSAFAVGADKTASDQPPTCEQASAGETPSSIQRASTLFSHEFRETFTPNAGIALAKIALTGREFDLQGFKRKLHFAGTTVGQIASTRTETEMWEGVLIFIPDIIRDFPAARGETMDGILTGSAEPGAVQYSAKSGPLAFPGDRYAASTPLIYSSWFVKNFWGEQAQAGLAKIVVVPSNDIQKVKGGREANTDIIAGVVLSDSNQAWSKNQEEWNYFSGTFVFLPIAKYRGQRWFVGETVSGLMTTDYHNPKAWKEQIFPVQKPIEE